MTTIANEASRVVGSERRTSTARTKLELESSELLFDELSRIRERLSAGPLSVRTLRAVEAL